MSYPPHAPPPSVGGLRPWHVMVAGVVLFVLVVVGALVFALTRGSGDGNTVRSDMEQRWDELDRETRIQTCADRETQEEMVVTVFVEAFEERAERRGEDVTVSREEVAEFLATKCG